MDREDIGRLRDVMLELADLVKESTELADKLLAEANEPAYPPTPGAVPEWRPASSLATKRAVVPDIAREIHQWTTRPPALVASVSCQPADLATMPLAPV